jgi:prepilin-type N-terminal cleavage/methylation domain-containing protein/prepilin-type processing-associated H-X9-DG protein
MSRRQHRGYTLIELLVVVLVISILASIAYPTYTSVTARARVTQDINNLRQIGIAMQTYLNDNDQVVPASGVAPSWPGTMGPPPKPGLYSKYIGTRKVYQSPFDQRPSLETDAAPVSYGVNANIYAPSPGINRNMAAVKSASSTIFMAPNYKGDPADPKSWSCGSTGTNCGTASNAPSLPVGGDAADTIGPQSNGQQINALFCDLHVETMIFGPASKTGSFQDTQSTLGLKHWDPTQ